MRKRRTQKYQFSIPCKPYIRKYVAAVYGLPFMPTAHSSLGQIITAFLDKKHHQYHSLPAKGKNLYIATLPIELTLWQYTNIGSDIACSNAIAINTFLEHRFDEALYYWCLPIARQERRYRGLEEHIIAFAQRHNIILDTDDAEHYDMTHEALRRRWSRCKEKFERPLKKIS